MNAGEFVSFPIHKIYPNKNLPGELYLYIGGRFIRYINRDDYLPSDKYQFLLQRRFQFLFVKNQSLELFERWSGQTVAEENSKIIEAVGVEHAVVATQHQDLKKEVINFVTREISDTAVKQLLVKTRDFIHSIQEKKVADKLLSQLYQFSKRTADHSINVAHLSTYLAINLGYNSQQALEDIYLGAILHDYGKTRVNSKYLEDPHSEIFEAAMQKHPALGKTALLLDGQLSDEALRIVSEHHERFDGKGFPRGLKGSKIYDLTKIVSIANAFDKLVEKESGPDIAVRSRKAIETLQKDQGRYFDPRMLARCIRAMNEVMI